MKKQCIILLFFVLLTVSTAVTYAAETSPEASASPEPSKNETIKDKIEDLKERLATRVAELRSKNRRAYYGVIKTKEDNNITIVASEREVPMVVDKDTTYFTLDGAGKKKGSTLKDIKPGQYAAAFGSLDLDQKTLIIKVIMAHDIPRKIYGVVKEVDVNEGTFTIASKSNTYSFDYEITTRCKMSGKNNELTNCGISKIKPDDRIFIRANAKDESIDKLKAVRILVLPATPLPTIIP